VKTALLYVETIAILVAVAAAAHFLASLDWPWAIALGGAAASVARALQRRLRTTVPPTRSRTDH
jgi:hypothetical protein